MKSICVLDGGGIRAIIAVLILEKMCEIGNCQINDLFDWVGGVSIGGFISAALVYPSDNDPKKPKWSLSDIKHKFKHWAEKIFQISWFYWFKSGFGYIQSKYKPDYFLQLLENDFNTNIGKSILPYACFMYDITNEIPVCYNSWNFPEMKFKDAIMGTTAAISYFPPYTLEYNSTLVADGGLVSNNPAEWMLIEAKNWMNHQTETNHEKNDDLFLLSIGTGNYTYPIPKYSGLFPWINNIFNILFKANEQIQWFEIQNMMRKKDKFLRWNVNLSQDIGLDDISKISYLEEITNQWINTHLNELQEITHVLLNRNKNNSII